MSAERHILLVPVDDSDVSEKVVRYCIEEMYKEGDEIRLFHVIPTPMPEYVAGGIDVIFTMDPDPKEDLKHIEAAKAFIKRRFLGMLEEAKLPYKIEIVHFLTDEDSIGEAICKRSEKLRPRAVVMAKHQRGLIKEFFLGSAAKHTVTKCKFPVMLLHEEATGGSSARGASDKKE